MRGMGMRPAGWGRMRPIVGPVVRPGRRRMRRLGLLGLLRGLFVLPLAAVLLSGVGTASAAEADEAVVAADAVMIQVGEEDHADHDAADEPVGEDAAPAEEPAAEQATIDALVAAAEATATRFADIEAAADAGYVAAAFKPVRGTDLLQTHALNVAYVNDGRDLDPTAPEGLMYIQFPDGDVVLVALVFTSAVGEGPTPAGDLITWHTHYVCTVDGEPMALPAGVETCRDGSAARPPQREMLHLWVFDHPDGPFAHGFTPSAAQVVIALHDR